MKLFENGVGRPSNEILRKRRKFYGLIIGCIAIVLFVGAYTLTSFNVKRLSGAASNTYTIDFYYAYNEDSSTGRIRNSQTITHGKETKLAAVNKDYIPDGFEFQGWKAYRTQDEKFYGYNKKNKLGWYKAGDIKKYYLYKNGEKVAKTALAGQTVVMTAEWGKHD